MVLMNAPPLFKELTKPVVLFMTTTRARELVGGVTNPGVRLCLITIIPNPVRILTPRQNDFACRKPGFLIRVTGNKQPASGLVVPRELVMGAPQRRELTTQQCLSDDTATASLPRLVVGVASSSRWFPSRSVGVSSGDRNPGAEPRGADPGPPRTCPSARRMIKLNVMAKNGSQAFRAEDTFRRWH